jgi:hypothetical protein
LSATYLAVV